MKLKFTITGNQEAIAGNPIPKAKLTKGQQWTDRAQRYAHWKVHVREYALQAAIVQKWPKWTIRRLSVHRHLFLKGEVKEATMNIVIHWANEKHADPESIFGSVADSLFADDKHLTGSFTCVHGKKGSVEVELDVKLISEV